MSDKEHDFYLKIRKKIKKWVESDKGKSNKWSEYVLIAPDLFYLLWKLSLDENVPANEKVKLLAAITYFISPIDLLPEALLGPAGYVDDIALTAFVLNGLVNNTDPEIVRKYWSGEEDILLVLKKIIRVSDQMVGKGLWQKLQKITGL